jgi:uncharacterized membrane protein
MWDLRLPAGLFFSALGIILILVGFVFPWRAPLAPDTNVNLYSGVMMLAFGGVMLWLAKRAS